MLVNKAMQRGGDVRQGMSAQFRLEPDLAERIAIVPPELKRFLKRHDKPAEDLLGRVITVNYNGKAVVDFQDGGWYDIAASEEHLTKLDPAEAKAKYDRVITEWLQRGRQLPPWVLRQETLTQDAVLDSGAPPARCPSPNWPSTCLACEVRSRRTTRRCTAGRLPRWPATTASSTSSPVTR